MLLSETTFLLIVILYPSRQKLRRCVGRESNQMIELEIELVSSGLRKVIDLIEAPRFDTQVSRPPLTV